MLDPSTAAGGTTVHPVSHFKSTEVEFQHITLHIGYSEKVAARLFHSPFSLQITLLQVLVAYQFENKTLFQL